MSTYLLIQPTVTQTWVCVFVLSCFTHVWLFVTLRTVTCLAPLSKGFSSQEYCSGLPFLPPEDLLEPGIEPVLLMSPVWIKYIWEKKMFKMVLEKAKEPEIKLPTSAGSKKQERSRKTSISALLTMPKPLTVWITINYGKFFKRWEYQTTWPASWETYMQVRKQKLELDME